MQKLKYVNAIGEEIDFTDFVNFGVVEWNGLSETALNVQSQQVPYKDGSVYIDSLYGERELSFTVAMNDGKNLSKRYELKRLVISVLNAKLGQGYLYYSNDFLEKRIKVIPQLPIFPTKNFDDRGTLKFSVSFTACIPYWEDLEDTTKPLYRGSQNVFIEGDVSTEVEMEIIAVGATNLQIKNITTDKKIIFPSIENDMRFNLNTGSKSLNKIEYNSHYDTENEVKQLNADSDWGIKKINDYYYIRIDGHLWFSKNNNIGYNPCVISDTVFFEHLFNENGVYVATVNLTVGGYYFAVSIDGVNFSIYNEIHDLNIGFYKDGFIYNDVNNNVVYYNLKTNQIEIIELSDYNNLSFKYYYIINGEKKYIFSNPYVESSTVKYWQHIYKYDSQEEKLILEFDLIKEYEFINENEKSILIGGRNKRIKKYNKLTDTYSDESMYIDSPFDIYSISDEGMYRVSARVSESGQPYNYKTFLSRDLSTVFTDWETPQNYPFYYEKNTRYGYTERGGASTGWFVREIVITDVVKTDNLISVISPQSDMDFKLIKGENEIEISTDSGKVAGYFTFRNKYIGV